MLKEIWEQEDSRYPANTTPKPQGHDSSNKNMAHYSGKGSQYEKTQTYTVRHTNVHLLDPKREEPSSPPDCEIDPAEIYDDGYYMAMINMANEADKWGRYFNCGKEGHRWAKCTELKECVKRMGVSGSALTSED